MSHALQAAGAGRAAALAGAAAAAAAAAAAPVPARRCRQHVPPAASAAAAAAGMASQVAEEGPGGNSTLQLSEFSQRQLGPDVIDLAAGQPGPALLPLPAVARSAAHRFAGPSADPFILQYGPEQGYRSFRAALASFLSEETGHAVDAEELLVTAGVSHGLDLVCRHLASPGDEVLVERPTYFLAGSILRQAGLRPVPVPTRSDQGMDVDALEELLQRPGAPRPALCYVIPVHNNPTGATLPLAKRELLLRLAHRHKFVLAADEVYQLLGFPGSPLPPPPPLKALEWEMLQRGLLGGGGDGSEGGGGGSRVVSLGSFSKIMAPGMRLGWIEASPALLARLRRDGVLSSGGSIAPLASGIVHSSLELGLLQRHLHGVIRPQLAARCAALCDALAAELPEGCSFHTPAGGYFVWLQLPTAVCSEELLQLAAARHRVRFLAGRVCDGLSHQARLSFAFYSPQELQEGARRLAAAVSDYLAGARAPDAGGG